jgi:hypothetical protein
MARLSIEQIKAPNLSVASQATARAGEAFQRATTSAADLLGQYQSGQEAQGDAELTNLLAGAKDENEWNNILASTDFNSMPLSAQMRETIINRRDNILGYGKQRADTELVGANTNNVNATADRTRNSTRIDSNQDFRVGRTSDRNYQNTLDDSSTGALLADAVNEGRQAGHSGSALPVANGDAFENYLSSTIQSESGGRADAKNSKSTAEGLGQFLTGTWAGMMKDHPELNLTAEGRTDPEQSARALRAFTQDNMGSLERAGIPITEGNLYAAHHLGAGGARSVLSAADGTLVSDHISAEALAANPHLENMTVGDFRQWSTQKGGGNASRQAVTANPNGQQGAAQQALQAALSDPNSTLTASQRAAFQAQSYTSADTGEAEIRAADSENAAEFAAQTQLDIADSPGVVSAQDAIVASLKVTGATAQETQSLRTAIAAGVEPGGAMMNALTAGTTTDPEATALAQGIIAERAAEIERSPMLEAASGAVSAQADPASFVEAALKGNNISSTPSEIEGALTQLMKDAGGITRGEAAYAFSRAAEIDIPLLPDWSVFGDNLAQNRALDLAKQWFKGDGSQEARQTMRDNAVADREVMALHESVQAARARSQKSARDNNGVVEPRFAKALQTATEKLDAAVQESIIRVEDEVAANPAATTPPPQGAAPVVGPSGNPVPVVDPQALGQSRRQG